ncbi:unnamed protein product [Linum tenue]|uniref:Uncharacterized protein n=1 Tax=Linum tenue TaxID=586396 RepID=A0AAV0R9Z5_9ROSI|nr:unnamed protein product [Linum tenue]
MCKSNGHQSSSLHDPRKWIPHKPQELEEFALLLLFKLVVPEQLQPLLNLIRAQAFSCTLEMLKHFLHWCIFLPATPTSQHEKSESRKRKIVKGRGSNT